MSDSVNRRDLLKTGAAALATISGVSAVFGSNKTSAVDSSTTISAHTSDFPTDTRKVAVRFAHFTDTHVKPEGAAPGGMVAALRHVRNLPADQRPDFIVNGGDAIMDALGASHDRTKAQWELWNKILADECALPLEHIIGNHDVYGWQKSKSKATGSEVEYGKKWVMDNHQMKSPYRAFDRAGWRFIILDSIMAGAEGTGALYQALLDPEQFEWLTEQVKECSKPSSPNLCLMSHIPIASICAIFWSPKAEETGTGKWQISGALMHKDARRLKDLFAQNPKVRLCLSGHIHHVDRVDFQGVTYLCNGAVSGSWWHGDFQGCPPGYALMTLYTDGGFEREYIPWGWTPELAAKARALKKSAITSGSLSMPASS
jgi:3',5'-cyclic-AMP phosphodiesterase